MKILRSLFSQGFEVLQSRQKYNFNQILLYLIILTMDNPEVMIEPHTMYAYDTHRNIPWNDTEYQPVKEYLDPLKQVTERKYRENPNSSPQNYVTRRGFYMDYHIKVVKALPSPVDHPPKDPWDQTINQKKSNLHKLDPKLSKFTYLDLIENEQKVRAKPAPGSYNLNKTNEQIENELKVLKTKKRYEGEKKHFFYDDTEYLSNNLGPGAGNCNPHLEVSHLKMNKTTHKFWIDKHKKESIKMLKRRSVEPAPGTHTPIPCDVTTFDRIRTAEESRRKKGGSQEKKVVFNGFGSDSRFEYTRQNKKKIIEQRPPPSQYNLVLQWKGKNMDIKKDNWIRSRSYGPTQSVYH